MAKFSRILLVLSYILLIASFGSQAQVNAVEFGRNRVQYKKFKWQYYQTKNFNTFFNQKGQELGKFVLQVAEEELPDIEKFVEYSLQRRINIVVYNEFADYQQTNIGLGTNWLTTGGITKLVNNKMVVYFNGDHANLRKQIREGIARVLVENILFGEDLGEFAGNQALLDLPQWLTDGYIAFAGENWSTALDDELKSEILSGNYKDFHAFAFDKPLLAGHAFWYYIQEKYKKENTTYFLYLARIYKNLNKASLQVCKMKFNNVLKDFMEYEEDKYDNDIRKRKSYPKGQAIESFDINKRQDYYRINVNPNKKNNSYAFVEYKKGQVRLKFYDGDDYITLLKYGIRSYQNETNPDYPLMSWDPKGTRLTVIYNEEGKIKLFVYDVVTRIKNPKLDLTAQFTQIQDVKYMYDSKTLLLSATKNGHTDIFTYDLSNEKVQQVTNDVYDDIDPSYVSFPNKTGIIFASNRPSADARGGDTVLPSKNRYNVFIVSNFSNKAELNQITQLSNLQYGNARYPMPYNDNHFTFISDENGVANRYAGFFTTKSAGVDTLVLIGDDILRNPSEKEVDSSLKANHKTDVDSIAVVTVSQDSAYTFPLSNYVSSVAETRVAGDLKQVSEVTRQSDDKTVYKLKIDENTLKRRNVTVPPTAYMKNIIMADKIFKEKSDSFAMPEMDGDTTKKAKAEEDIFQTEFEHEIKDSSLNGKTFTTAKPADQSILSTAKLYDYKPSKFYIDFAGANFNNSLLINRYQPYQGGYGPIMLNSSTALNGLIRLGTSELMEDVKVTGAFRISSNLKDNEWMLSYQNYRRRLDWGLTYYRNVLEAPYFNPQVSEFALAGKLYTNLYQVNVAYPFDAAKSLRFTLGARSDRTTSFPFNPIQSGEDALHNPDLKQLFSMAHLEYVYDNTLNPAQNIWHGLRYKAYIDWNTDISKEKKKEGKFNFNWGFDARYYYPIYRNFIWAGRAAADFSWGNQKTIYYLGGVDSWMMFGDNAKRNENQDITKYRYFDPNNPPASDASYAFQSLAVNMRGFIQNVANGNNNIVLNSEFRLPVFTTLMSKPLNNAFIRNFQVIQFIDLGSAWNGSYGGLSRPEIIYRSTDLNNPISIKTKAGGVGPFVGGYGFGARSTLLGYFLKFDAGWPMSGFFRGKPVLYFAMGFDF